MPTLEWIGKKAVVNHHRDVPFHLLEEVPELSYGDKDSGNMLIQGDNLIALKALLPYYAGKVKCIYIDPPYNTGNDSWVYNDNVNNLHIKEWLGKTVGKEAEDLTRHDKWLCMIYPRLRILKDLLTEDGVIFISIDDNEQESLKHVCNEIFGAKNFVAQLVWNTEGHTDNQFHVKINHEYILMYARREEFLEVGYVIDPNTREESNLWAGYAQNSITKNGKANPPSTVLLPVGFPVKCGSLSLEESKIPDGLIESMEIEKLPSNQLKARFGKINFPLKLDKMIARDGKLIKECRVYSGWANVNKLKSFINNNCEPVNDKDGLPISFFLSENGVIYYRKDRGENARNILSVLRNLGTTEKMRSEIEGMGIKFNYPKPKELIKYLIEIGSKGNDIILDSFAGSGTTGHAILELNYEKLVNRKFILVEMLDYAKDVTAKRLKHVIKQNITEKSSNEGFRYYRLGNPLFDESGKVYDGVSFSQLARHVFFTETGQPLEKKECDSPLIGEYNETAIYLLFNGILKDKRPNSGNVLTNKILEILPEYDGTKVIYGTACRISPAKLKEKNIIFKQIPYDINVG